VKIGDYISIVGLNVFEPVLFTLIKRFGWNLVSDFFLYNVVDQCEFSECWCTESHNLLKGVHGILSSCNYFYFNLY
jgi:hypothetical protein